MALGQGHALADTLYGKKGRQFSHLNIPSAVFSTPPLATVGLTEEEAMAKGETDIYVSSFLPLRHRLSQRPRKSLIKLVVDKATQKVLGKPSLDHVLELILHYHFVNCLF